MIDNSVEYRIWCEKNGLSVYDYQKDLTGQMISEYKNHVPLVLAACTGAGKTNMSIFFIEQFLKENPGSRVLVLTHGTVVLRSQFLLRLNDLQTGFTYTGIESRAQVKESSEDVLVALPQSVIDEDFSGFDLLIVDEAHHFYLGAMVQNLIKSNNFKYQVLLTGTPSDFVLRGDKILCVAESDIIDYGQISDLNVEIASSSYTFGIDDFNRSHNLKQKREITEEYTKSTLDSLLDQIVKRIKSLNKNNSIDYYSGNESGWSLSLRSIGKTMISCQNQRQARQVYKYMLSKRIDCALSTSHTDYKSDEVDRFQDDPNCKMLIVVNRGVLGFDMPELETVIDMTLTQNIDRIKQLMGRALRVHPKGKGKLFIKITTEDLKDYYKYIMTCVLCLTDKEYLSTYNGTNFREIKIPVNKIGSSGRNSTSNSGKSSRKFTPINFEGMPVIDFFKSVKSSNPSLSGYAYVRLINVSAEISENRKPNGYWQIKENCIEKAGKYETRIEFEKGSPSAYNSCAKNGWLKEACAHMAGTKRKARGHWDIKENCLNEAKKYKSRKEFHKGSPGAYQSCLNNSWIDEACAHMAEIRKTAGYWEIKENCLNEAKKYKSRNEFRLGSSGAYESCRKNNWLEEACAHMKE